MLIHLREKKDFDEMIWHFLLFDKMHLVDVYRLSSMNSLVNFVTYWNKFNINIIFILLENVSSI